MDYGATRALRIDAKSWSAAAAVLLIAGVMACAPQPATPAGKIADRRIRELSGLAPASTAGQFWCLNDSGNPAEIFRIDNNGQVLQAVSIVGARNIDWEAMSRDEAGRLLIADVGDNARRRSVYTIYRVPEPAIDQAQVAPEGLLEFRYHDGASRDCEAMFVMAGGVYLVSKEPGRETSIFRVNPQAPPEVDGNEKGPMPAGVTERGDPQAEEARVRVAELITKIPSLSLITDAAYSPERMELALLTYVGFVVHRVERPEDLAAVAPEVRAGFFGIAEALSFDGGRLVITNERGSIWRVDLESR